MEITPRLVQHSSDRWSKVGIRLFEIEKEVFEELSFDEEYLKNDISNPNTILVVLKRSDEIIGFTYAEPESDGVARVVDTAILKQHQKQGLIGILSQCLEDELRSKGFKYITEDVMIYNGYADAIDRHYGSKILERKDFDGRYGKQRHFKIKL